MFEITPETRAEAIEAMREVFLNSSQADVPDDIFIEQAFDAAVAIVKKQFGI